MSQSVTFFDCEYALDDGKPEERTNTEKDRHEIKKKPTQSFSILPLYFISPSAQN
jgi:hypothetical protein